MATNSSFTRRTPDIMTEELCALLSQGVVRIQAALRLSLRESALPERGQWRRRNAPSARLRKAAKPRPQRNGEEDREEISRQSRGASRGQLAPRGMADRCQPAHGRLARRLAVSGRAGKARV